MIFAGYEYLGDPLGSDETGAILVTSTLFLLRLLISSLILFISSYISLAAFFPICTSKHFRVFNDSLFFMIAPFSLALHRCTMGLHWLRQPLHPYKLINNNYL
tara:strand:+ start:426 stop:734 length:309 start_codon:yes stop_codon:yes gene_type:complete